jgi:GDSL-like lipase/acylhydrolase family protein
MRLRILVIGALALAGAGIAVESVADPLHITSRRSTPALARGTVSLVGDSLNVGIEPYLEQELQGWEVHTDDVVGRPTTTGLEHLGAEGASLGRYVVISLGTNDPEQSVAAFRAAVDQALGVAGTSRCVVWATIHRGGDAYEPFNGALRAAAGRNRNLRVVEWATMVDRHPSWLVSDGVHATPDGYRARAEAVVAAMRTCPPPA